jgi:2'-5' RNA ligase
MSFVRTFIAVESSGAVASRAAALIDRLRSSGAKVAWVKPEQFHWTLKFLGDVDLTQTAEVCRVVGEAVASIEPFDVEVRGVGAFPDIARPRTVWLGVSDGSEPLAKLAEAIDIRLAEIGFKRDARRFNPHLTLGRVRSAENVEALGEQLARWADYPGGMMEVDEVIVFASFLERDGARHEPLGHFPLGIATSAADSDD